MLAFDAARAQFPRRAALSAGRLTTRRTTAAASRPFTLAAQLRRIAASVELRQDDTVRRQIARRHETLAHQYEVGGAYSDLP